MYAFIQLFRGNIKVKQNVYVTTDSWWTKGIGRFGFVSKNILVRPNQIEK